MARGQAHLVIFPWPATGHFDSVVQLLYSFDSKRPGIIVTVVCTGKLISQLVALQDKGDFTSIDLRLKEVHDTDIRYEKDPVFPYRSCLTSESLNEEAEAVKAELVALKGKPGAATAVLADLFLYWCKVSVFQVGIQANTLFVATGTNSVPKSFALKLLTPNLYNSSWIGSERHEAQFAEYKNPYLGDGKMFMSLARSSCQWPKFGEQSDLDLDSKIEDLADELGVPWYAYSPCGSAASVVLTDSYKISEACVHHQKTPKEDDPLHVAIPNFVYFPGISSLYYGDIPNEPVEFPEFYIRMGARIKQAAAHLINTSEELDAPIDCLSALKKILDSPKIFCIGPSLQMPGFGRIYSSVNTSSSCLSWLDAQKEKSVLYVSFGSLVEMSKSSIRDLASGLEASGVPFLWALKIGSEQVSEVLPPGFVERTSERGLVETGWVPQRDILLHPATGGFFTHCGWNSTMESICAGIPLVGWPVWADQFMNVRYIQDRAKIGIAVSYFKGENKHNFKDIGSREIELAIKALLLGDEGRQARANVEEMQKVAKASMAEGGSSYQQVDQFLDEIAPHTGQD